MLDCWSRPCTVDCHKCTTISIGSSHCANSLLFQFLFLVKTTTMHDGGGGGNKDNSREKGIHDTLKKSGFYSYKKISAFELFFLQNNRMSKVEF